MNKCLYCYKNISETNGTDHIEYHTRCSRKFFGKPVPPILNYSQSEMFQLAEQVVQTQRTITGVQPKISLISKKMTDNVSIERFTIIGLWGQYR